MRWRIYEFKRLLFCGLHSVSYYCRTKCKLLLCDGGFGGVGMSIEKFEKWFPLKHIFDYVYFSEDQGNYVYHNYDEKHIEAYEYVNSAWSAWQEQQKVIDELEARMAEADKLMDAAASDGTECVEIWTLYKALRGEP